MNAQKGILTQYGIPLYINRLRLSIGFFIFYGAFYPIFLFSPRPSNATDQIPVYRAASCLSLWERCPSAHTGAERVGCAGMALSVKNQRFLTAPPKGEPRLPSAANSPTNPNLAPHEDARPHIGSGHYDHFSFCTSFFFQTALAMASAKYPGR